MYDDVSQVRKLYLGNTLKYWNIKEQEKEDEKYRFFEYIENDNHIGGVFDTSYIPTNNTKAEIKITIGGDMHAIFSGRIGARNQDFGVFTYPIIYAEKQIVSEFGDERQTVNVTSYNVNENVIQFSKQGVYLNGELITQPFTNDATFSVPIAINGANENNQITQKTLMFNKIYYFKLWENDELVRSWKPALRIEDNKVGLYDEINDSFIEPVIGSFSIPKTENVYAKFDDNSYFNTNVTISSGTQNFRVICGVYLDKKPTTNQCPFGMRYSSFSFMPLHTNAASGWRMNMGSSMTVTAMTTYDKSEYELDMQISGNATSKTSAFAVYDITHNTKSYNRQTSRTYSSLLNSRPMWVGAMNDSQGTPSYFQQYIKYVRVYRGNNLQNNFIFKEVDGIVKMYDTVTDTYFDNLGTGQVTLVDINQLKVSSLSE